LVTALPPPNAFFDYDWAIWRVKDGLARREAVDFLRKSILDTTNRPPTITDAVCVTTKVTKAHPKLA
jgi:hypothetical protein